MNNYIHTISQINKIVNGELITSRTDDYIIKDLLIDSRKLINTHGCLFFALSSKRNDGHKYISTLYKRGLRNFVVTQIPTDENILKDANYILVKNTLLALQELATFHRKLMNYPVISITGSNGKTIVKEWAYQVLQADKAVLRSPKSFNSQIGVPLSVWQMNENYDIAIFEAGISQTDEMDKLQKIIQPNIGIYTNIGEAHGENFINNTHKAGEKLKLFTKVDTLIYSPDQKNIHEVLIRSELLESIKSFTWSRNQEADLQIQEIIKHTHHTTIGAVYKEQKVSVQIPFTDNASIENAIQIWCLMMVLDYDQKIIEERLFELNPVSMRLELKKGANNCSIINDSYNSDIDSLKIALDFLNLQNQHQGKTLILSDILQSGKNELELYSEIAELIKQNKLTKLIGVGPAISRQADKFDLESYFYEDTNDFIQHHSFSSFKNESILLKGARSFEFEKLSVTLQEKTHQTVLEVNLDHMLSNLNFFKSKLKKETKMMVMVKAFSYGSGSFEIANLVQYFRADYLSVAYADEGVELRKSGISLPIMVMSPDINNIDTLLKYDLEPEIYNFRILSVLEASIKKTIQPKNKPVRIHLKLDTGMNRLGFDEQNIEKLVKRINDNPLLKIQSVFSHLANSDDTTFDKYTNDQFDLFNSMCQKIQDLTTQTFIKHMLNSAGISRFPEQQMDMVRLGLGLYGLSPIANEQKHLLNVNLLKTTITQIKQIKQGDSVGYSRAFVAKNDMKIATIPIGYADGIHRFLGNGKYEMTINGKKASTLGNICMDMCMLDISHIDCQEGDEVIVFQNQDEINEMAKTGSTIAYEIISGISQRVKRVYFKE